MAALARFFISLALTLLGLTVITFVIGRVIPIDPVIAIVGDRAPAHVYERTRLELGLDKPIPVQYALYLQKLVQGDLGQSVMTGRRVTEDLAVFFPATLELATVATLIGVILGVPLGVIAAARRGTMIDHIVRVVGLVGYSVPVFWLGLVGLLIFYARLDWVAGPGRADILYDGMVPTVTGVLIVDALLAGDTGAAWDAVMHLVLPAGILGYFSMAYIARMTRSFMLNELAQEYVTTARVKGLSEARVIWRHALGNTVVPLITVIVLTYASLLEGAVLTETVFAWPGIGLYIKNALFAADMSAVLGATIVIGAVFMTLNRLSDLLYHLADPRARS
ncbi:ABC transporter permease [Zavarzinia sp. CC-PAN008]|uniref:ABC transporter permease n=1 Tax=Zavarzinia sp. CC-PAN008 TaxID=3243332 RepID=UPI003F74886E